MALQQYAALCLANGCIQFRVLERKTKSVTVFHGDASRRIFIVGESIPLDAFGGDALEVAQVFQ